MPVLVLCVISIVLFVFVYPFYFIGGSRGDVLRFVFGPPLIPIVISLIGSACGFPAKDACLALSLPLTVLLVMTPIVKSSLPRGRWAQLIALAGYAWPLQFTVLWASLGLPPAHGRSALLMGSLGSFLVIFGQHWFIGRAASLGLLKKIYGMTCLILGMTAVTFIAPLFVYVEGLSAVAQIPSVPEIDITDQKEEKGDVKFVQISDTHVTGTPQTKTVEGNPSGEQLLPAYRERILLIASPVILITGDLTDGGEPQQWEAVTQLIKPLAAGRTVIMAPGNHDLGTAYSRESFPIETHQQLHFLELQAELEGRVQTSDGAPLRGVLAEVSPRPEVVMAERKLQVEAAWRAAWATSGDFPVDPRGVLTAVEQFYSFDYVRYCIMTDKLKPRIDRIFPLTWHSGDGQMHVFVLNSSTPPAPELGRSALGRFGRGQLDRFEHMIKSVSEDSRTRTVVVLSHHPLARPLHTPTEMRTVFNFGLLRLQATESLRIVDLLRALRVSRPDVEYVICYGHRHERHYGTLEGLRITEAPNLREQGGSDRGIWVFYQAGSGLKVRWTSVGK